MHSKSLGEWMDGIESKGILERLDWVNGEGMSGGSGGSLTDAMARVHDAKKGYDSPAWKAW